MKESNSENYTTDKPIYDKDLDAFQRYGFSKRIAETIVERNNRDSLVFGIFGVWGEGKSSVLNFINNELSSQDEILTLVFNPWRYGNEDTLIKNFLKKVSELLGEELSSNREKFASFVAKYGSVASIIGVDFSEAGKNLADVDLEDLKKRVDEFISESGKRLVIFIDDIDRLDKQEIYSLFRLVKLTADFKNTTYILSFDHEMVASALGERFGSGDKKAGENFLEKIIQVPLSIPKAQPAALKKFCFKLVDNAILNSGLNLAKDDVQRFVDQFTTNILSRLTTPRLAVRYGNTLSFSLPLLKGEVNIIDLMLIEALRVFYPEHYSFVKNNPDYFIGSYQQTYGHGQNQSKIDLIKERFKKLDTNLDEKDRPKIRALLSNLFPILDTAFGNFHFGNNSYNEWYINRRIVSTKYFDRYFSYDVIEGDISDVEFDLFIKFLAETDDIAAIISKVQSIIDKTSVDNFIQKLRSLENDYSWESSKKISKALSDLSENFPKKGGMLSMGFETPFGQAAIFIKKLLENHKEKEGLFEFAKELMIYPKQFSFAYEINNWFRSGDKPEEKLFKAEQYIELAKILTERAVKEAGDKSIFNHFPERSGYIARTWVDRDKPEFENYVDSFLEKDVRNVLMLLKTYTPTTISSNKPEPFKGDLSKDRYDYLISLHDKEKMIQKIKEVFTLEEIEAEKPFWIENGKHDYTDLNMVRQFFKWYNQGLAKEKE